MESFWSGDIESAFFSSERMKEARVLRNPEYKKPSKSRAEHCKHGFYYVLGVDVGRFDCATEVAVIKVTQVAGPQGKGYYHKQIVNIYSFNEENFIQQSINIKKLYWDYLPKAIVLDSNGLGAGLLDILISDQVNPENQNQIFPGLGVINDDKDENGHWRYKPLYTQNTIRDVIWSMKANVPLNSEMYSYCQQELMNNHLKFLISESEAKNNLLISEKGKKMSPIRRADFLRPFTQTSILIEQMANLVEDDQQQNIILKQSSRKIKKDKFSALIYGLFWIKHYEETKSKRKTLDVKELMFFN